MSHNTSSNFDQVWTVAKWEFLHFFKLKQEIIGKLIMLAVGLTIYYIATQTQKLDDVYHIATDQEFVIKSVSADANVFKFTKVEDMAEIIDGLADDNDFDAALVFNSLNSSNIPNAQATNKKDENWEKAQSSPTLITAEKSTWQNQLVSLISSELNIIRFNQLNLTAEQQVALSTPIHIEHKILDDLLKNDADYNQTITAFGVLFLLIVAVFSVFGQLFVSITGEKQNRVTEQLMAAMTPQTWIDGKLLGQILFALKTMVTTLISIILSFLFFSVIIKQQALDLTIIHWSLLPWLFAFAIAGLAICAAFMAAVASAIDDPNHSGKSGLMMLPLVPVIITFLLIDSPNGVLTILLSYLPITAFAVMPVRMSLVDLPAWQPILSLALSGLCFYYFRIVAARVFKMGMNMYGKEPSIKDMFKAMYKG
ncbi:ABC transporter permease [Psychrosphaera aquimarina]|uniref:ABC transporter permease n=1 Tax=Psychrosphaera aquimarina TaxID=2044854 RepID=A0ABU3QW43_9GAMM|nr:ABC transporter permease [Psychrosphaera aquimarina]MDU0111477.1 ABC transporter permease [Psychrosphaera aquimarina]